MNSTLLRKYPLILVLLPAFFVLNGYTDNFNFVPVGDAFILFAVYFLATITLLFISRLLFKSWIKAGLFAFTLMSIHIFFGSIQDTLRQTLPTIVFSKYVFLLPFFFILTAGVFYFLRKRTRPLSNLLFYLNTIFLLFIIIDLFRLMVKMNKPSKDNNALLVGFQNCRNCSKPDVYMIFADEYAGESELNGIFHFDNSSFYKDLERRNFHYIRNSSSNYNSTPYSIASTLEMEYLNFPSFNDKRPVLYSYEKIKNNKAVKFFQSLNYKFYNNSWFDIDDQPAHIRETFLPSKTRLITGQTLLSRIHKEIGFHLVTTLKSKKELEKYVYYNHNNNKKLFKLSQEIASKKTKDPKFVITHLMLPHYPYYFDRNGAPFPFETLVEGQQNNQERYLEYLQYGSKKLIELIDYILEKSTHPPIIILVSDHGFRHFDIPVDPKNLFTNLMAIHLPSKSYSQFADSLTNVNLLRTLLNTEFGQNLPYLKDTSIIMNIP